MTSLDKIERAPVAAPATAGNPRNQLAVELAETLKLAVPIALTQLGQIAMMTTDLALIGRLGMRRLPRRRWRTPFSSSPLLSVWDWCPRWRRLPPKHSAPAIRGWCGARFGSGCG